MSAMSDLSMILDDAIEGIAAGAIHYADIKKGMSPEGVLGECLVLTPHDSLFVFRGDVKPLDIEVIIRLADSGDIVVVASNELTTGVWEAYPYGMLPMPDVRERINAFIWSSFK